VRGEAAGGPWAARAAALYNAAYARRYREHDDQFDEGGPYAHLSAWLATTCQSFDPPIDVLDLGCGTGRYFWALEGVRELVGLDASAAMLAEAGSPCRADRISAQSVTLVRGDLFEHDLEASRFDLVYSIGVLAEHVPFSERVAGRVRRWLREGGRFAFTTVHPESPSIPSTAARRAGRLVGSVAPPWVRRRVHARLLAGGLYADESSIQLSLGSSFAIESLERFQSEAHLHCLCVARKRVP
jgi:SAM-dependent methyltransferase